MPKISVIVPVYKVEPYLHRCVDSILAQTFSDFELILVDDGSPDNCPAICDEYAKIDYRVVVIHQENGGLSAARNAGIDWAIANSDSEWITFIDSDDYIHSQYLEVLYNGTNNGVQISMCSLINIHSESQIPEKSNDLELDILPSNKAYIKYYYECMTCTCKIYKKNLWFDIRFPIKKLHEDAYITHLLIFQTTNICYTNAHLYYYMNNPNSITRINWSPKRMEELEGREVRLDFFFQKNSPELITKEAKEFWYCVEKHINQIKSLQQTSQISYKHRIIFKKQISYYIKKYKPTIPLQDYPFIYNNIFPKRMYIYWLIIGICNKLKCVLGVKDAND